MPRNITGKFILCAALVIDLTDSLLAAPSNGTRFPPQWKIESGYEYNVMFERPLARSFGDLKTQDHLYTLSFGVFDWLAVDGQAGIGDVIESDGKLPKLEYNTGFAGGYGFRARVFANEKWGLRAILGGQHICVHPQGRTIDNNKYEAILDDWQISAIIAKDFKQITVYTGISGSDCEVIYKLNKHDTKRISSDSYIGLITGVELYLFDDKARIGAEGRFFSETALSVSASWLF
ncbi:MAG: hypothetical protein KJ661_01280 [Candidatus Omnitrophica bacterium]|nr:hypothetical protein [Candidatus Omnitrophota bacterium]